MPTKKKNKTSEDSGYNMRERCMKLYATAFGPKKDIRRNSNMSIYKRIEDYILNSRTEAEMYAKFLMDFPAFSAFFLSSKGIPIYLAPWQQELNLLLDNKKHVLCYAARRMGKTTLFAAKAVHLAVSIDNTAINVFAPSEQQDRCYREIRNQFQQNQFLFDKYVKGNTFNTERIELSNGSTIENYTVDIAKQGRFLRGSGGTVLVDEISLIPKKTLTSVIFPMISDAYRDNSIWLTGTPSLDMNAELDTMTDTWKSDNDWGVLMSKQTDWHRGLREECINYGEVMTIMKSMSPDEIVMEYCADFPRQQGRFFPATMLSSCFPDTNGYRLLEDHERHKRPGQHLIMAVDWARVQDRTEILVAEVGNGKIRYLYWKRLDPLRDNMTLDHQIDLVKQVFHQFGISVLMPDFTSHQDIILQLLTRGKHSIPEFCIWKNHKDEPGYRASDDSNHQMWFNHKRLIAGGSILAPSDITHPLTATFVSEWKRQHNNLNKKKSGGAKGLLKLEEPRGGFKDLAVVSAMLSLAAENTIEPPWLGIAGFGAGRQYSEEDLLKEKDPTKQRIDFDEPGYDQDPDIVA